jgi:hypothetical protein
MAELFGFEIKRKAQARGTSEPVSFAAPEPEDGALQIQAATGGSYGQYIDLEGSAKNEAELVTRYRKMSIQPEVDVAIDDIVNEAIVNDPREKVVDVNLDGLDQPARVKRLIQDEFNKLYKLLSMGDSSYDIFKKWYIDGRLYYHAMIDEKQPEAGIKELRYIDPRKIRKVREVVKVKEGGVVVTKVKNEYYIFSDKGFNSKSQATPDPLGQGVNGVRIAKDSIVHVTSGLMDENNKMVLSHLHKAIKPLNQLQVLEDAAVIYRISRAPERRIFYIDVGNSPKMKAEQYLADMMTKHKNRLVYDASDGSIRDDRKFMTMLEDFWLPRREGGRGTEITTLPGGQNLGEMDDIEYFKKKLFRSLNVPVSRLEPEGGFTLGRASEISRDELKFSKFVRRLRMRFSHLFDKTLEKQLVLKGVCTTEEWYDMKDFIRYDFVEDNHFSELKNTELMRERLQTLNDIEQFEGKYFSREWIRKTILRFNEEDIERIDTEIELEREDGEAFQDGQDDQDQQPEE